jgi:hypothetical protein
VKIASAVSPHGHWIRLPFSTRTVNWTSNEISIPVPAISPSAQMLEPHDLAAFLQEVLNRYGAASGQQAKSMQDIG